MSRYVSNQGGWGERRRQDVHQRLYVRRGALVPFRLYKDLQNLSVLIDGAPEIHAPSPDRDEHFVEMPLGMSRRPQAPKPARKGGAKTHHPPSDRFVRKFDASIGQKLLDVAKAERGPSISGHRPSHETLTA